MSDLDRNFFKSMVSIVNDLYGTPVDTSRTVPLKPAEPDDPAPKPTLPPFRQLWKTADETIDWTDILVSPNPTDGLTPPEKWAMLHKYAPGVLKGDIAAYLAVLQAENPMADLTPYVASLDVTTVSADQIRAVFAPRSDLMEKDVQEYLCGMALRTARDLMAALPVLEVEVHAVKDDKQLLKVTFTRQMMNKVRFAFVDPIEFAQSCGAVFAAE